MIRSLLRSEFDQGHGPWFLLAAMPLCLLLALSLPAAFFPFIVALPCFLLFFHSVRKGRCHTAFWMVLFFAFLLFSLTFLVTLIKGEGLETDSLLLLQHPAKEFPYRSAESFFVMLLSGISGGGLAILAWGMEIPESALNAVAAFRLGGSSAALLSLRPWLLAQGMAQVCLSIAAALIFYAKLEKRCFSNGLLFRWLGLALSFMILDLYLEWNMATTWNEALYQALYSAL